MKLKLLAPLALFYSGILFAAETTADPMAIESWSDVQGVSIDPSKPDPNGKPSLKVEPKGYALLKLRPENAAGRLSFFVFDDKTLSVPKAGDNSVGPHWGLARQSGRAFVGGIMYAKFLNEGGDYTLVDVDTAKGMKDLEQWYKLHYGRVRGKPGWVKWEFEIASSTSILIGGKRLDSIDWEKFNWAPILREGFNGMVLFGDGTKGDAGQTVWVGGIEYVPSEPAK